MITIDFEVRSAADLKAVGSHVYACDKSTEILCLAWRLSIKDPIRLWASERFAAIAGIVPDDLDELFEAIKRGDLIEAHNAGFERRIWHEVAVRRFGWMKVPFESWRCSMAKAAAMGLPQSLDLLGKALDLDVEKDAFGHAAMKELTKPLKRKKDDPDQLKLWIDDGPIFCEDPIKMKAMFDYCKTDVEVESQASEILEPLSERELKVWRLDQKINDRGFYIDRDLCEAAIAATGVVDEERSAELTDITNGEVTKASQVKKIKGFLGWLNPDGTEKHPLDAEFIEAVLKRGKIQGVDRRVLEIRLETAKSSVKKFIAILARSTVDGRMRDILRYYGAFTGRWSGSGAQIQNFPRGVEDMELLADLFLSGELDAVAVFFGDLHEAAKNVTRGALIAAPGKKLLIWDYGQIEARVLGWLADDVVAMDIFRDYDAGIAPDPYVVMARDIYNDQTITKATHSEERGIGKIAVLGLGYQMGKDTFRDDLEDKGAADHSIEFAEKVVKAYRAKFETTVDFWYRLNDAAKYTVRTRKSTIVNSIRFSRRGRYMLMTLPSGRSLYYLDPRIVRKPLPWNPSKTQPAIAYRQVKNKQLITVDTYGGKLCENATQGTARCLMVDGMLRLDEAGYPINGTVHDEVIAEVDQSDQVHTVADGRDRLEINSRWSIGVPLVAGGFESQRYRKD